MLISMMRKNFADDKYVYGIMKKTFELPRVPRSLPSKEGYRTTNYEYREKKGISIKTA